MTLTQSSSGMPVSALSPLHVPCKCHTTLSVNTDFVVSLTCRKETRERTGKALEVPIRETQKTQMQTSGGEVIITSVLHRH